MKTDSLRIGNLIEHSDNGVLVVRGIFERALHYSKLNSNGVCYEAGLTEYSPIKLTEEWLLRFGFEKEQHFEDAEQVWSLGEFHCDERLQPIDAGYEIAKIKIDFVHQLQNLYFALTGKELKIV